MEEKSGFFGEKICMDASSLNRPSLPLSPQPKRARIGRGYRRRRGPCGSHVPHLARFEVLAHSLHSYIIKCVCACGLFIRIPCSGFHPSSPSAIAFLDSFVGLACFVHNTSLPGDEFFPRFYTSLAMHFPVWIFTPIPLKTHAHISTG